MRAVWSRAPGPPWWRRQDQLQLSQLPERKLSLNSLSEHSALWGRRHRAVLSARTQASLHIIMDAVADLKPLPLLVGQYMPTSFDYYTERVRYEYAYAQWR